MQLKGWTSKRSGPGRSKPRSASASVPTHRQRRPFEPMTTSRRERLTTGLSSTRLSRMGTTTCAQDKRSGRRARLLPSTSMQHRRPHLRGLAPRPFPVLVSPLVDLSTSSLRAWRLIPPPSTLSHSCSRLGRVEAGHRRIALVRSTPRLPSLHRRLASHTVYVLSRARTRHCAAGCV